MELHPHIKDILKEVASVQRENEIRKIQEKDRMQRNEDRGKDQKK
jgi:hypothetical protein